MTGKQRTEGERNLTRFGQPAPRDAARQGTGTGTAQSNAAFPTGIAAPAIRALTAAGYSELRQLAGVPASELKQLHGMGPKALARLQEALEQQDLSLS